MGLFLRKIIIENYKCFEHQEVILNVPDGINEGSGLNILIGENANGKTSILEAINYLTLNSYSAENKLSINDFFDKDKSIQVKCETDEFNCQMPYPGNYFECAGIEFIAKCRERKSPGKLLSSSIQVYNFFINKHSTYKNSKNQSSGKTIQALYKIFSNENIIKDEINVFFFDKNRTRQISTGTFKTTFDKICEDLNWKFSKNVDATIMQKLIDNICGEYFKNVIDIAQKGTGERLAKELKNFFNNDLYEKLKIELIDLLHPFSNAFFALRDDNELKQIRVKDIGSGIEMILTILLLKSVAEGSKGTIIYLIDEPELHLHPVAQDKLLDLLMNESKKKQIIISTHSPYLFKNCLKNNIGLIILNRDKHNKIKINYPNLTGWGKFPWSPSWGEINFHAFGLATIEFHNELYGYIQETTHNFTITEMDNYLLHSGIPQDKSWIRIHNGIQDAPINVTLPSFIRNSIHHPENTLNLRFRPDELIKSVNQLLNIL